MIGSAFTGPGRPGRDVEDVAVLDPPAELAVDDLLARDPGVPGRRAAGAVRVRAAEDGEGLEHLERALARAGVDDELRVAAAHVRRRRVVTLARSGTITGISPACAAVLVVADEDVVPRWPAIGGHAVEDAGHEVPVAHHLALALDDRVVEVFGQPEVALVDEWPVARHPRRPRSVRDLRAERVERAERRESPAREQATAQERLTVERVHVSYLPESTSALRPSLGEEPPAVGGRSVNGR